MNAEFSQDITKRQWVDKELFEQAKSHAYRYIDRLADANVYPSAEAIDALKVFDEPMPDSPGDAMAVLDLWEPSDRTRRSRRAGASISALFAEASIPSLWPGNGSPTRGIRTARFSSFLRSPQNLKRSAKTGSSTYWAYRKALPQALSAVPPSRSFALWSSPETRS